MSEQIEEPQEEYVEDEEIIEEDEVVIKRAGEEPIKKKQ